MNDNELFVGGWYYIGDNPYGHTGELAYIIEFSLTEPVVLMHNNKTFECRKCDLLPLAIKSEYLLENGWEKIQEDEDGSICYGIDVGEKHYLDWWTPTEKVPAILAIGWEKEDVPIEVEVNTVHKLQQMLMFWGVRKPFMISNFLPQFKHSENEAKKDVNKKKHKHKH